MANWQTLTAADDVTGEPYKILVNLDKCVSISQSRDLTTCALDWGSSDQFIEVTETFEQLQTMIGARPGNPGSWIN